MSKNVKLDLRLRDDQKEFVKRYAEDKGVSMGTVIGWWIDDKIKSYPVRISVGPHTTKEG